MKYTFLKNSKIVLSFVMLFMVITCSKYESFEDERKHYQFEEGDFDKLLSYELNQIITFKNQEEEEKSYRVTFITTDYKTSYTSGGTFSGGQASVVYYYDQKEIHLIGVNSTDCPIIQLKRRPVFHEGQNGSVYAGTKLYGIVRDFRLWNGGSYVYINFEETKSNMIINSNTYEKVHVIDSENTGTQYGYSRINIFYYDEQEGIIGFDDLDGKEWRLVN